LVKPQPLIAFQINYSLLEENAAREGFI